MGTVLLVGSVLALLIVQWDLQGSGSVESVGLGVYWDPECTDSTSSLDFGLLTSGASKNFTLYLRNEGNSVLTLNMTSENWDPPGAVDSISLTWNLEGQQIGLEEVTEFVITLSVSDGIQGIDSFSMDIVISGIA